MKKSVLIPYLLFAAAAIAAIVLLVKLGGLQEKENGLSNNQAKLENTLDTYKRLSTEDSLLVSEKYNMAIEGYNQLAREIGDDSMGIKVRIAFAQKMMKQALDKVGSSQADSLGNAASLSAVQIEQKDSLKFALEKANIQLRNLRSQLKERSFGEYLTFKSKKGNQMHYVGKVSNGMANGYGMALLDTGSRYEGEWKDNQRHGEGSFYWSDGDYYVGHYENAERNGLGTYYFHNGEKYVGDWKNDKRNGEGNFYGKDGSLLTSGIWKDDKLAEAKKK